ncbi:DUF5700 domain-containing putative Zn-dependent protease [Hymenobacter fodinae]|uniref:Zn-dependent protease DUF2268 n=1 Tax=Hymenobacter fodinae TaxID=2510796 RepID=A0A4Z0P4N6_9BACT|nr:DUF5700 domain-containing putative Zn-dependent protease [Hymenobacter fodinae]TGE05327.1 hypothetical protein EU556_18625 [Hymenobacter fodinae]
MKTSVVAVGRRIASCLWLLGLLMCASARAQTINTDAVTRFWQLTDELRQNHPISDKDWDAFINLPGNKTYIRNTFHPDPQSVYSLENYRRALETVYMPQHDSLLRVKLRDKVASYVLAYEYKEREAEYRQYIQTTIQSPQYVPLMYTLAYEYLPKSAQTTVPELKMYYTAIGDGATSQADGIFYSLKAVVDHDKAKPGIVEAHEMYHQLMPTKSFSPVAEEDKGLMWTLRGMRSEGIADLIDKAPMHQVPGDPHRVQAQFLQPAPQVIQRLDSVIQAVATQGTPAKKPVAYYQRVLHFAGHVPGCYMARVIVANGYRKELIARIDNPFEFVRLYQKAARKDATHPPQFSQLTMKYLAELEKTYNQPAANKS